MQIHFNPPIAESSQLEDNTRMFKFNAIQILIAA